MSWISRWVATQTWFVGPASLASPHATSWCQRDIHVQTGGSCGRRERTASSRNSDRRREIESAINVVGSMLDESPPYTDLNYANHRARFRTGTTTIFILGPATVNQFYVGFGNGT